jgi:hypothetical protein
MGAFLRFFGFRPDMSRESHFRRAAAEWGMRLAVFSTGLLLFETLSGLTIYALPFGAFNEHLVLVHTLAGVVWFLLYAAYQLRHYLVVRRQVLTHVKWLGYLASGGLLATALSGFVLTAQAGWGTRIGYGWDLVHTIGGFVGAGVVALHLLTVLLQYRRQKADEVEPPLARARLAFWRKASAWGAAPFAAAVALALAVRPVDFTRYAFPADYSWKYGDNPFAPSLVRTVDMKGIAPRALAESKSCGTTGCHAEIVSEWIPSAHRYASMEPPFQAIQKAMAANNGPESTRYCAGCHDPVALFSGSKNLYDEDLSSYGADEGVSCVVCHSIVQTDVKGNANYTIARPARYAWEQREGAVSSFLADFTIRAYPSKHLAGFARELYRTPEYCAACHKQFIDKEINNFGWVQLQNQYDNWRKSHWHVEEAPESTITCRECHMRLVDSKDPAAGDGRDVYRNPGDGKHRSHRFIAANQLVPPLLKLPGWEEQVRLTEEWLRGDTVLPEVQGKWARGPAVPVAIEAPASCAPGEELRAKVVVTNQKVGHDFPTGPLDIIQAWVDFRATDAGGREFYASGRVDEKGFIEEGSFIFKAEGIDAQGNLIDKHNLWEMVGARFRRSLFPGFSDSGEYRFPVPADARGPIRLAAKLRYRKADQYLVNVIFGEGKATAPVTDMSFASAEVALASGQPAPEGSPPRSGGGH